MEGVERRLKETHDKVETDSSKQRAQTQVADISGIEATVTPPRALIKAIEGREGYACPQAFQIVWESGTWKGLPVSGYCAEPLCRETGSCTGTRFVPHVDQWTPPNSLTGQRERRVMSKREVVRAVRSFAKEAAKQTGRDEERTDSEILSHVKTTWRKTLAHIRDTSNEWRRS